MQNSSHFGALVPTGALGTGLAVVVCMNLRPLPTLLALTLTLTACGPEAQAPALAHLAAMSDDDGGARHAFHAIGSSLPSPPEGGVAPVLVLGDRRFVALGRARQYVSELDAHAELALIEASTFGGAAEGALEGELAGAFASWDRRPVTLLDRTGAVCAATTGEPRVIASFTDTDDLFIDAEGDCIGAEEGEERCREERVRRVRPSEVFRRGEKSFAVELDELGECEAPVVAISADAPGAPRLAMHLEREQIPADWARLVERHPTHRENQARADAWHRDEGDDDAPEPWLDLDEATQVFHFEGEDVAYVLVLHGAHCGSSLEPLRLLVRQPLDGAAPELVELDEGFAPGFVTALIEREGALEFIGGTLTSLGIVSTDGVERVAYDEGWYGCGC
jgi:hypothetical protein